MPHPALENMSYEELAGLIQEAKALMAEKFPNEVTPEKPFQKEVDPALDEVVDVTDVEQAADPYRSPTS